MFLFVMHIKILREERSFEISGLRFSVNKIFTLLGCYAAQIGSYLRTVRDNLSVLSSRVKQESRLFDSKRCYVTTSLSSITSQKNEGLKDVTDCPFRVRFYFRSLFNTSLFLFIEDYVKT